QASKIIYLLATGENIQNGNYTVTLDNAICSETLFTDDVIFTSTGAAPALNLDGCRVLGSVIVNTRKNAALSVKDSALSLVEVTGSACGITMNNSTASYVTLEAPAVLNGNGYGTVYLTGEELVGGTVELSGGVSRVVVMANAVLKAGELPQLEVAKKTSLTVQSGDIDSLQVSSGASGSMITLAGGVYVDALTANAACSFMGKGTILSAKNNVSGVTYETKPKQLTGTDSGSTSDPETGAFSPETLSPAASATGVSVSTGIVLSFDRSIYDKNGNTLTASDLTDYIQLRRSSSTGAAVDFSVTVSGTRSRLTLTPEDDLSAGTRYYVHLDEGAITDANGNPNAALTYYFTTSSSGTSSSQKITFSPANAATGVSCSGTLKITFSSAVRCASGVTATTSYLSQTAVELRESGTSGTKLAITATLNSTGKILTVQPEEVLKPNTRYYLIITSGSLEYTDGTNIARTYAYFNTSDEIDVTVTPAGAATNISPDTEILLTFNTEIYRPSGSNVTSGYLTEQAIELHKSSASGTKVDFTAVISSDRKTVRVIPASLDAGTKYYVVIPAGMLANENGTENAKISSYFTTATAMAPAITPTNGSEDVPASNDIVIRFTDALYDKNKNPITADYVESGVVTLKKTSSTGTVVPFEAKIDSDYKTITITPLTPFSANTTYYVAVAKSTLYNENGKANTAGTSLFKTAISNAPDFLPYNGESDVDIATTIDITFDRTMYAIGGATLTTTYVKNNVVEVYKDSYDGTAVAFSVTLSADKQTITVKPTAKLEGDTTYLVVVRKASLEDSSGNENALYTSSFTTAESISTVVTVTPENRASGISVNPVMTFVFESPVYRSGGSIASNAYLLNNVFELRKGSSTSGTKIACTASISADNKTVTLIPEDKLETKTTYYLRLLAGTLEYGDGTTAVPAKTVYFTTGDGKPVVQSLTVETTGAASVTAQVTTDTAGTVTLTAYDSGKEVAAKQVTVAANEPTLITLTGLASNHSYTVAAYVTDSAGVSSAAKSVTAKTLTPIAFEVTEVTDTSVTVVIDAMCDGTLDLSYKNQKTGTVTTRVSGLGLKEGTKREFVISGLDSSTAYTLTCVFTDLQGGSYTVTDSEVTAAPKVETLAIASLVLTDANGDTYTADVKDGKASFTIEKSSYIKLTGVSSVSNATFTYNGGIAVKPGVASQSILVTPGETATVTVVLVSGDTGNAVSCEVSITVNA
ncbi:MAG: Ig-like domain-containing protein, partial [Eubacteriales bacterium]